MRAGTQTRRQPIVHWLRLVLWCTSVQFSSARETGLAVVHTTWEEQQCRLPSSTLSSQWESVRLPIPQNTHTHTHTRTHARTHTHHTHTHTHTSDRVPEVQYPCHRDKCAQCKFYAPPVAKGLQSSGGKDWRGTIPRTSCAHSGYTKQVNVISNKQLVKWLTWYQTSIW